MFTGEKILYVKTKKCSKRNFTCPKELLRFFFFIKYIPLAKKVFITKKSKKSTKCHFKHRKYNFLSQE